MRRRQFEILLGNATAAHPPAPGAREPTIGSLTLIILTLLILLHASTVACAEDAQNAGGNLPNRIEIPADKCGPAGAVSRSWAVVADKTASSGVAVKHTQTASTEAAEPFAICQSAAMKNSDISVRFKVLHGARGGGGVAFRMATPEVYYLVRIDVLRSVATLVLVNNGTEEEIVAVDAEGVVDAWQMLTVRAQDERFTVFLNGIWIFTGYDKTLADLGRLALWAEPGGTTLFDRITTGPSQGPSIGPNGLPIGTYTFSNGDKYVGEMSYGALHGQGTYTFRNGDKYVGEFKRGTRTGNGTYAYVGGDSFVGTVVDRKPCGFGIYRFANGSKLAGEFKDGQLITYLKP